MGNFTQKAIKKKKKNLAFNGKAIIWEKKKYCFRISRLAAVFSHYMNIINNAFVIISPGCFKQANTS